MRKLVTVLIVCCLGAVGGLVAAEQEKTETFPASPGGKLVLDLQAGGEVAISGDGGGSIVVTHGGACTPACELELEPNRDGLTISNRFERGGSRQSSRVDFRIRVPSHFDVEIDSMGGGLSIDGVAGTFRGKTMGGELTLHGVDGEAELTTMGGRITLTDSTLDGSLKTMGGEVLFENVVGDVYGSSMGGNVRYKNVQRRSGDVGAPGRAGGVEAAGPETVQISTMGGAIDIAEAPEGADLHTMGGNITVEDARRFVRAKTMGGDIAIRSVDGWVEATTMGGHIEVALDGDGGAVTLTSMSGDVSLTVPAGFGMDLDLEIAFTRNSGQDYRIRAPGDLGSTTTPDWDHGHGSPRKYIRTRGAVGGGGNPVVVRTVNGNITVHERR